MAIDKLSGSNSRAPWLTLISLLSMFTMAIAVALILVGMVRNEMLQRDAQVMQQMVQSVASAQEGKLNFSEDPSGYQSLENFLNQVLQIPDVLRGNIYSNSGTVLWSSEKSLEGQSYSDNKELLRAARGELIVEIGRSTEFDKAEQKLFNWRLTQRFTEIYIPIREWGRVVGVVELYKVPHALSSAINATSMIIWSCTLLIAILLSWFYLRSRSNTEEGEYATSGHSNSENTKEPGNTDQTTGIIAGDNLNSAESTISEYSTDLFTSFDATKDHQSISAVDQFEFNEQSGYEFDWNKDDEHLAYDSSMRKWLLTAVVLLVVVSVPVLMGSTMLYRHGISPDSALAELTDTEKSPMHFFASALTLFFHGNPKGRASTEIDVDAITENLPASDVIHETTVVTAEESSLANSRKNSASEEVPSPATGLTSGFTESGGGVDDETGTQPQDLTTSSTSKQQHPVESTRESTALVSPQTERGVTPRLPAELNNALEINNDNTELELEMMFWSSIVDVSDPSLYAAYLEKYPNGEFSTIARRLSSEKTISMRTESDVYIQLAWQAFSRKALTTPAQDCAVKWAKLSLALVPQNEQALAVLRGVIDTYLDWSLRVEAGNRPALAAHYLTLAQSLYQYASDEQESIITTLERNMDINAAAGNTGFASTASDGSVIAIEDTHKELRDDKQVLQLMVSQLRQRLTKLGIHQRNIPYLTN